MFCFLILDAKWPGRLVCIPVNVDFQKLSGYLKALLRYMNISICVNILPNTLEEKEKREREGGRIRMGMCVWGCVGVLVNLEGVVNVLVCVCGLGMWVSVAWKMCVNYMQYCTFFISS